MEFGKLLLGENVAIKTEFVEIPPILNPSASTSAVDQWWNSMGVTCDSLVDPVIYLINSYMI